MTTEGRGTKWAMRCWAILGLFLGLGLALPARAAAGVRDVRVGLFALSAGGSVTVENMEGTLAVEGWDRAQVEVVVAKEALGSGERLDDVHIAVKRGERSLTLRTVYPNDLDTPVQVNYRLRVPRLARLLTLRTLMGDIVVKNVEGLVDARTLHGEIQGTDLGGSVTAQALTGNIAISLRTLPASSSPVLLETVSGNVSLLLPPRADASLELRTVAGHVAGAYAFEASSVPGDGTLRTQVGRGGVRVSLRTIRGDISVAERNDSL